MSESVDLDMVSDGLVGFGVAFLLCRPCTPEPQRYRVDLGSGTVGEWPTGVLLSQKQPVVNIGQNRPVEILQHICQVIILLVLADLIVVQGIAEYVSPLSH